MIHMLCKQLCNTLMISLPVVSTSGVFAKDLYRQLKLSGDDGDSKSVDSVFDSV